MSEGYVTDGVPAMSAVAALEALRARNREREVLPDLDGSVPPPLLDRSAQAEANAARRLLFRGSTVQMARPEQHAGERLALVLGAHSQLKQAIVDEGRAPGLRFEVDVEGEPGR